MDRLTRKTKSGNYTGADTTVSIRRVYDKMGVYEDAEEQGLLLKLPCKVGDYIWNNDFGKPCGYEVTATNLDGKAESDAKEVAFDFDRAISALEEIQQYRALGTVEELREAREKQRGNKMKGRCPDCGTPIKRCYFYCPGCGQAIDWNDCIKKLTGDANG